MKTFSLVPALLLASVLGAQASPVIEERAEQVTASASSTSSSAAPTAAPAMTEQSTVYYTEYTTYVFTIPHSTKPHAGSATASVITHTEKTVHTQTIAATSKPKPTTKSKPKATSVPAPAPKCGKTYRSTSKTPKYRVACAGAKAYTGGKELWSRSGVKSFAQCIAACDKIKGCEEASFVVKGGKCAAVGKLKKGGKTAKIAKGKSVAYLAALAA